MTDETGLAAALARWNRPHLSNSAAIDAETRDWQGVADAALAWLDARLADPATVEAVAVAVHLSTHMEPDECECRPDPEDEAAAEAALAVVRGLLGGTGGEG